MKWEVKKKRENGDKRKLRRFAWWPVLIGTTWVWLETFEEEQTWHDDGTFFGWRWSVRRTLENYPA